MAKYVTPGIYVKEVPKGAKPIKGVPTSTAGFVGMTERGKSTPQLVTSWSDFQRKYGGCIHPTRLSYLPLAVKGFFENGGQRAYIARVIGPKSGRARFPKLTSARSKEGLAIEAIGNGEWGSRIFIRIEDASKPKRDARGKADPNQFRLTVLYYNQMPPKPLVDPLDPQVLDSSHPDHKNRREPTVVEQYDNVHWRYDQPNNVLETVNSQSHLIHIDALGGGRRGKISQRPKNTRGYVKLSDQAPDQPTGPYEIIGETPNQPIPPDNERTGLAGLEVLDEVALLCVPDEVHSNINEAGRSLIRRVMVNQCQRTKDRFAVLQLSRTSTSAKAATAERMRLPMTSYAAVYHPWIRVSNPIGKGSILIPPAAHVCGIMARTDNNRGVHKAPANEIVRGIITTNLSNTHRPLSVIYTKDDQNLLNSQGINIIRDFRSTRRGIRVWGARTLASDPDWTYVNIRRFFLFMEESIDEGTQWVVFEPNSPSTWSRVRRGVTSFLNILWREGALEGATPKDAFFVKCDRTTMTQDDIDNGRLIMVIGVAPVKPAEFVIFRIGQKTMEAGC